MATTTPVINNLMFSPGPAEYYTEGFRQVLEDHMAWLRTQPSTSTINISAQAIWENEQDLFGFLQSINMAPQYHWPTMRLNNMDSPNEFVPGVKQLLIPATLLLDQLRSAYLTSSVMNS
jgi:hypothetical protein